MKAHCETRGIPPGSRLCGTGGRFLYFTRLVLPLSCIGPKAGSDLGCKYVGWVGITRILH